MPQNQFRDIANTHLIKDILKVKTFDPSLTQQGTQTILIFAIKKNLKVDFYYEDSVGGTDATVLKGYREVSPVALGTHKSTGNMVFRGYLLDGISKSKKTPKWRLFRVDRVMSIRLNYSRQVARFDKLYRPNDKHIGDMLEQASITEQRKQLIRERKQSNT